MSIFDNAIRSIQIGLQDYAHDDRLVSSVRNIYAGILLLFKHKLTLLSGEDSSTALVKQKVVPFLDPEGAVVWRGVGSKTVDVGEIKDRFKSLGVIVDWKVFERISKHRNNVEHYFGSLSGNETYELLADCFVIISRFLTDNLHLDAKEALGYEAWQVLLHAYEVYEDEDQRTAQMMNTLVYHHDAIRDVFLRFRCITCSSSLVTPRAQGGDAGSTDFSCAECKEIYSYDDICNFGIPDLYLDMFFTARAQSNYVFGDCEFCKQGIFLNEFYVCTECGCVE